MDMFADSLTITCWVCRVDVTGGKVGVWKGSDFKGFIAFEERFSNVSNSVKCRKIKALGTYRMA